MQVSFDIHRAYVLSHTALLHVEAVMLGGGVPYRTSNADLD